ncbi:hypothetical protein MTR01_16830 [Burkholderia thailandensis]|uniref:hypothetical protein n=1 Tax=Burkholderia thailandensis TaxID=57975 RepID=UPI0022AC5FB3|nr:hypothetical protein [Burkholderia thailandensis]MCZ2895688.1 hypothetical protein [Burkholderia thailandensis]
MTININKESISCGKPLILNRGSVSYAAIIISDGQRCIALVVDNVKRVFLYSAALLARLAEINVLVVDFSAIEPETFQDPGVLGKVFTIREKLGIGADQGGSGTSGANLKT